MSYATYKLAMRARSKVQQAIKKGELVRPSICEICNCDIEEMVSIEVECGIIKGRKLMIYAHHWRGYNNPLDVWWICPSCNRRLVGKHDGSLSLDQVRKTMGTWNAVRERHIMRFWYLGDRQWINDSVAEITATLDKYSL